MYTNLADISQYFASALIERIFFQTSATRADKEKKMRLFVLCLMFLIYSHSASAQMKVQFGTGLINPIAIGVPSPPPAATYSLGIAVPATEKVNIFGKVGGITNFATTPMSPYGQLGLNTVLTDGIRFGAAGLYRFIPETTNPHSHVVGMLAPVSFGVNREINVGIAPGLTRNLTLDFWSLIVAAEVSFTLPF